MTYCVGLCLEQGLVMASDSRTNAGVDYISSFSKLHIFQPAPDRLFVMLAAGSLATTQDILNRIRRDLDQAASAREQGNPAGENLSTVNYMFEAAAYIGQLNLAVQHEHGPALRQAGVSPEASLIMGGQIAGQPHELFLIYSQGNCIAATPETPYLQIGESKFGKPVLDRFAQPDMSLEDGARLCLVSLDGTARSNLTVAPPFEVALYPKDALALSHRLKFKADTPELLELSHRWEESLARGFQALPHFVWEPPASSG
jgi:putative proteasome-type protease